MDGCEKIKKIVPTGGTTQDVAALKADTPTQSKFIKKILFQNLYFKTVPAVASPRVCNAICVKRKATTRPLTPCFDHRREMTAPRTVPAASHPNCKTDGFPIGTSSQEKTENKQKFHCAGPQRRDIFRKRDIFVKKTASAMNIEETKREMIDRISELQDEKLLAKVKQMLESGIAAQGVEIA